MATGPVGHKSTQNDSFAFAFERNFDEPGATEFMVKRWTDSLVYGAIYIVAVFAGQTLMKTRPRYDLRLGLALWSAALAFFSILGTIRMLPETISAIGEHSWQFSMCDPGFYYNVPTNFWAYVFVMSKVLELGDTLFVVLRKQQLIFLHWYHHTTVMVYCWHSYAEHTAPGRWFIVMNFFVHSVMYSYYALRAMRFNIPKQVNVIITSLQLTQMMIGVVINISIYNIKARGEDCQQSNANLYASSIMYFSYFVLFAHFFYKSYIAPKPKSDAAPIKAEGRDKKRE